VLSLDQGIGEPEHTVTTGPDGRVHLVMNEPPSSWATLIVEAEGYVPWQCQFRGKPAAPITLCLHERREQEEGVAGAHVQPNNEYLVSSGRARHFLLHDSVLSA
jgi:hypothetical protein